MVKYREMRYLTGTAMILSAVPKFVLGSVAIELLTFSKMQDSVFIA